MNERIAIERGYSFTGHYEFLKDNLKSPLEKIRKQGYKAVVVTNSSYEFRGAVRHGGYSIYADQRYFTDRQKAEATSRLSRIQSRRILALKNYHEELAKIKEDEVHLLSILSSNPKRWRVL